MMCRCETGGPYLTTTHTSSSLVCIRKVKNAEVVGTGFLVDEQHIITCAHVVAEALEWSRGEFSPDPPQELIHLDFPLLDHNTILTARVVFWQPVREDWSGGDIAGLQLMSDAPVGAEAVRFALAEDVWDHDFRVFGFPSGQDNGVWATGRLLDRQASNWIQIEDNKIGGLSVIPGFSGGAVWDGWPDQDICIASAHKQSSSWPHSPRILPHPLILNDQTRMYTDQRGHLRPDGKADGTAMCDIGAYEAPAPY